MVLLAMAGKEKQSGWELESVLTNLWACLERSTLSHLQAFPVITVEVWAQGGRVVCMKQEEYARASLADGGHPSGQ